MSVRDERPSYISAGARGEGHMRQRKKKGHSPFRVRDRARPIGLYVSCIMQRERENQ